MTINSLSDIQSPDPFWWKSKSSNLEQDLFGIVKNIEDNQRHIAQANLRHIRLYANLEMLGMGIYSYFKSNQSIDEMLKLNMCKAVTDTLAAKISKNKPKPTFLTSGGDFSEQMKAHKLDQAVNAIFYQDGVYTKAQRIFIDACVLGTGIGKIFEKDGHPTLERTIPMELFVDNADGYYGLPRSLYQKKYYNREILLDMFPEAKRSISIVETEPDNKVNFSSLQLTDQVKVVEAWHLPSGTIAEDEKTDGRHIISIANKVLFDEEWRKPFFPFVFLHLNPKLLGFWGSGVCEELAPLQLELNKLLVVLQQSMHLTSVPKLLLETSSNIIDAQINNDIGTVIEYSGMKPEWLSGGSIPPELISQINWLWQRGFEQFGISQLSATSQKPAGLNAGVALREYNDIETERFVLIGQRWEQFFVDLAKQFVSSCKDIYSTNKDYKIQTLVDKRRKKYLEEIKWKEVDLDDKDFKIEIFPTSSLPTRPEGRLQKIQEMIQAGMISPEDGMRLLDFPDFKTYLSFQNSPQEDIDMVIEEILESSIYQSPEPFQDLTYGMQRMQKAYLRSRVDKVPEAKLELMRRWMAEADALLSKAMVPQVLPVGGNSEEALVNPEPTSTNELIPNVNAPLQ